MTVRLELVRVDEGERIRVMTDEDVWEGPIRASAGAALADMGAADFPDLTQYGALVGLQFADERTRA